MEAKSLWPGRPTVAALIACLLISITSGLLVSAQSSKKSSGAQAKNTKFSGAYTNLQPAQRRLVDEWFRQYNEVTKQNLKSSEDYDELAFSVRTTFEAVTHALMTSKLTDKQGRSLGTALDVISYIETVHGKIPEASGDLQFRIYVALKPTALQTLENSREFKRGGDNTVYHKGYPINYRQQGGVPSIQISSAPDGKRADIDVDYRSSKFPKAVVNGHLSSANSDVRAGDNYNRHVKRWSGFANWWKSVFGLPLKEADLRDEALRGKYGIIPQFPRAGKGKPEEAMYDFLNSWLVEQKPELAVAYISTRAFSCIDQVPSDEKKQINPGLVPYHILEGMRKVNRAIGKPATLGEAAQSVQPKDPALKIVNQPHIAEFDFFEAPEDMAFDFECDNRNGLEGGGKRPERKYGKYYGATTRLKSPQVKGALLVFLWTKESDHWKIVSWRVEPEKIESKKTPTTVAAAPTETRLERVAGDPEMIKAAQGFFDNWFVKQNIDQAMGYFSQQCYLCINLYLNQGEKMVRNWPEGQRKLHNGMKNVAGLIGKKTDLAEAIRGVTPAHPILKLVTHSQEQAFTLVSVPDSIANALECQSQARGVNVTQKIGAPTVYGNYYGALFEAQVRGQPAVLKLLWGKEKGQWKIIAYSIELP